jgi:hypothetical protein
MHRLRHLPTYFGLTDQLFTLQLAACGLNVVSPGPAHVYLDAVLAQYVLEFFDRRRLGSIKLAPGMRVEWNDVDLTANPF